MNKRLTGPGSPRTIFPSKYETNRNTSDGRTNEPAGNNVAGQKDEVDTGEVDDGFRMERSEDRRGRSLRRRRAGLTGAAFLLLAIKAIMRCHTIRVPTLKYDKTIQMLGIRLPSFLDSPSHHPLQPRPLSPLLVALRSGFFTLESWDGFVFDSREISGKSGFTERRGFAP